MKLRTLTTLLLVVAAGLAAGCGAKQQGKPLPRQTASQLLAQLQSIQDRFDFPGGQACADITGGTDPNTNKVRQLIDSLPSNVDPDLRSAVQASFDHLFDLVQRECSQQPTKTNTDTNTTPTDTTPSTDTTPTDTTPTDTTPTDTTPTDTTPTDTTPTAPTDTGGGGGAGGGTGGPGAGQ